MKKLNKEEGSLELIVLGLLAALIVVLAVPLLKGLGDTTYSTLNNVNTEMYTATHP